MTAHGNALPLAGVRVLDLGRVYLGPWAGTMLAHAGAEVIKVEEPGGEPARRGGRGAMTLPLAMLNTAKHAITLDLKHPRGRELLLALVEHADVLIENFAPGTMDDLGLGPDVLQRVNPRLVYGAATGFGIDGPARDQLAMDVTIQAWTGVMSATGFPDGPPVKAGPAFVDILAGTHLYAGVVTALYERERTGRGSVVDVAMVDTVLPALASNLVGLRREGVPARTGNRHAGGSITPYDVYPAADGWLAVIVLTDRHWRALATAMGRPELGDHADFATNPDRARRAEEVDALVAAWTSSLSRDEACGRLQAAGVPSAAVRELPEVVADEHLRVRGALVTVDTPGLGPVAAPRSPLRFRGTEPVALTAAPDLGAGNDAVYGGWLGLDAAAIDDLRAEAVI
ncbi:MAG TPA: CaiB/BaiF CoA-transferase family protein [Acidimicrobiales bacterium]|nr:CaiB/BaiF CoA-transferase family protein [Acidimicrobiales bacterium]